MIYVTHDQIEALTLADRVAVMHDGKIQQLATPSEVYRKPANRFVAGFVGSPAMNFRKGKLANGPGGPSFHAEGLQLPLTGYNFVNGFDAGRDVELGVRPEHVVIGGGADRDSKIEMIDPMGAETLVWCRVGDGLVSVRMEGESDVRVGETLKLGFPANRLNVFDGATGARL
jgi:multiple sugar transport system ATP-binding protein